MNKLQKLILILVAVAGLVVGAMAMDTEFNLFNNVSNYFLRKADTTKVESQMASNWSNVRKWVAPLDVEISKPQPTYCDEGDPSLYAFSCISKAEVKFTSGKKYSNDPYGTAEKLQVLDKTLKVDGWDYGSNDFRRDGRNLTRDELVSTLMQWGAEIEYHKGDCDIEIHFSIYTWQDSGYGTDGDFACAIDDGFIDSY